MALTPYVCKEVPLLAFRHTLLSLASIRMYTIYLTNEIQQGMKLGLFTDFSEFRIPKWPSNLSRV